MDDVDHIVVIEDEHHLKYSASPRLTPHQPLLVRSLEWEGLPSMVHDLFGFLRLHPVAGQVFLVPLVPPKRNHPVFLIQDTRRGSSLPPRAQGEAR